MANRTSGFTERASGVFSGLRNRLSGNRDARDDEYDDYADYDNYDNYGDDYNNDYGEYGYDAGEADDYDNSAVGPVSTRAAGSSSRYSTTRDTGTGRYRSSGYGQSSYRSASGYSSNPHLVSMDEARSSVSVRGGESSGYTPSYRQTATTGYRSAQAGSADTRYSGASTTTGSSAYQIPMTKAAGSRSLEILRPREYGDVADMASTLRRGDAVVLMLKNAPAAISTRVLDFAFGVASALDANVECVGDRAFFVVRGEGISDAEREKLRLQGVVR